MNYILNSIEEIQKVYTPDIKYLNDDFMEHLFEFKLSKKVILESMKFKNKFTDNNGGEGFSSELSFEEISTGIKHKLISANNLVFNLDCEYLIKNIDLKVFETELNKLLKIEENRFVLEIKEELEKGNNIAFEMRLNNDIDNLDASHRFLNRISEDLNKFDKILIEKYKKSYKKVYEKLKKTYEHFVSNKNIFSFFGRDFSNDSSENEIRTDLWDIVKKGTLFQTKHIKLPFTENTKSTISEDEIISIDEILSEPIKKLTKCGFYEVLQNNYPEVEKQQSIIATIFRIHINKINIRYNIITVGTQYYNFCFKIGLIEHLEKSKFKNRKQIAKFLNEFSSTNEEKVNEINIKTFENIHTNQEKPQSNFYPFSTRCEENVNVILSQLNLI